MLTKLVALLRDSRGATAVEYGLIVALIALAALTAIKGVASETIRTWNKVANETAAAVR